MNKEEILALIIVGFMCVVILVGAYFWNMAKCYAKTEDMGMASKFSLLAGCRVEHEAGKWIPLERFRIMED